MYNTCWSLTFIDLAAPKRAIFSDLDSSTSTNQGAVAPKRALFVKLLTGDVERLTRGFMAPVQPDLLFQACRIGEFLGADIASVLEIVLGGLA